MAHAYNLGDDARPDTIACSDAEALELFRRSPHPYHRRQHELDPGQTSSSEASRNGHSRTHLESLHGTAWGGDSDGRKQNKKASPSPSESGTEADDEGYSFVRALPAPPLRPRKGLRNVRGNGRDGDATPLLTPSQVDEEGRKLPGHYFQRTRNPSSTTGGIGLTDDEAAAAHQSYLKYLKRRRNEIARRVTEVALLTAIAALAVGGCRCWQKLLQWHRAHLLTHLLVVSVLLLLYPCRLLHYSWRKQPPSNLRFSQRIRIPAVFDPAPVLYPQILPVLISVSVFSVVPRALLPNIVLALAALPPQLIPHGHATAPFSSLHWLISMLPLMFCQHSALPTSSTVLASDEANLPSPELDLPLELLVCLFPLHQALLPPLHYLTTTSLLPTELHLLSIALINLLLFADSPQGSILRTLLWLGGVGLFVLCGKVLKWGVAIARVPRWKFRRAGRVIQAQQSFLKVLNDSLRSSSVTRAASDSDADDDDQSFPNALMKTKSLKLDVLNVLRHKSKLNGTKSHSAIEREQPEEVNPVIPTSPPRRRNTVPSLPTQKLAPLSRLRRRRRANSIAQHFLNLTPTQAWYRKWLYAAYFYSTVIVLILGPIRYYIGTYALGYHEPFGWAIGYLLGNVQRLRFEIFNWDLGWWIALPPLFDADDAPSIGKLGPVEYLRLVTIGPANTRLLLCTYCIGVILVGLLLVFRLSSVVEVDTRRKVFHGMMVAMLLPTIFIDPCFVSLALSLVLAVFLLLDLIRASQLPPLSGPIATFLTPYVDGRDLRGPVVVSHIFLLIGCAIPLWLSLAAVERGGDEPWVGWETTGRDVSQVAGVVCVGMGDAAASLVGRRFGRRKWPWAGGKSLEGSLAFALAVTLGLVSSKAWLTFGWGGQEVWKKSAIERIAEGAIVVGKAGLCAAGASLEEAVLTGGNDNVIVPVVLWVLVRGLDL